MIRIYRGDVVRDIHKTKLQQYLSAGWSQSPEKLAEEVIASLKPPARVKAAVKSAEDDAIISKGE